MSRRQKYSKPTGGYKGAKHIGHGRSDREEKIKRSKMM